MLPPNQYLQHFYSHSLTYSKQQKNWAIQCTHFQLWENKEVSALSSYFSSHAVNKCLSSLCSAMFLHFCVLCLCFHCWKWLPKHGTEVLWSIPKSKKTVMYLVKKLCVLDKLCSSISYSTAGHKFNVNESMIWNIQKKEEEIS